MKIALFAGSFDPPSWGHHDIIQRSLTLCDQLIIAIAINLKKQSHFTAKEREEMVKAMTRSLPVEVVLCKGLLVDLAKKKRVSFLIRGLRNGLDSVHEMEMALANRRLSGLETIFLPSEHPHISSTLIRELIHFDAPLKEFVPLEVAKLIKRQK